MRIMDLLSVKPFAIIGHRGAAGLARENSLRALETAIRVGAEIAEFDVQSTIDGVLVASHDDTVLFDDGVRANIRSMKIEELKGKSVKGEPIPTIEEIVEYARGSIGLFLEVKVVEDTRPLINLLKRLNAIDWVAIISFHDEAISLASRLGFVTGLLYFKPPGRIVDCAKLNCRIVLPRYNLATEKAIELAHRFKLRVVTWTVNDVRLMEELATRGVDGIATDYPNIAVNYRRVRLAGGVQ